MEILQDARSADFVGIPEDDRRVERQAAVGSLLVGLDHDSGLDRAGRGKPDVGVEGDFFARGEVLGGHAHPAVKPVDEPRQFGHRSPGWIGAALREE